MAEEKKFNGVSLIIGLNQKDDAKGVEPFQTLAFFAKSADAKLLHSAVRISEEAKAPAKYVAFPTPGGFDIVESIEYAKTKGAEKGLKIGVVLAKDYQNAQGKDGVLYSGVFNPAGMPKKVDYDAQPYKALGSFTGPGAVEMAAKQAGVMAAAKAKREAGAAPAAAADDAAPAAPASRPVVPAF